MSWTGKHAVIIGGSLAGLSAARVLSDFFDEVTVYERDELPEGPVNRGAVPQGRHVHMLMARGAQEYNTLFPGLLDDMVDSGVAALENRPDCIHFGAAGHVLGTGDKLQNEFTAYVPSRPHLEWQIRKRVLEIPNVDVIRRGVVEPVFDAATQTVTGVVLDSAEGPETVDADLVVDATGRGTRLPVWLEQWGFERPREETVDVGIGYVTHKVRIPEGLIAEKVVVAGASRTQPLGVGALYYEDGTWSITTFGTGKHEPPKDYAGMHALVKDVLPPHFAEALDVSEPVGDPAVHKYPVSKWRRFDKLSRFPKGIVPFGDAVVSFNPTYGQGMTMTSIQAANLREVLRSGDTDIAGRLQKATAKTTWPVWMMDAIGDLTLHNAPGDKPWWYSPVGNLFDMFLGAAETEPVLAEWFLRRFNQLDSLWMVPTPSIVVRTCRHNFRLWRAERRELRNQRQELVTA